MEIKLGDIVYHIAVYDGREPLKVIGIRETTVELEGDYSGGTHNVRQSSWLSTGGVRFKVQPDLTLFRIKAHRFLNSKGVDSVEDIFNAEEVKDFLVEFGIDQYKDFYNVRDLKKAFEAGYKKGFSGYPSTENWKELTFEEWLKQFKKEENGKQ